MTYALYIPENYSLKKFKDKSLDYGRHGCAVELVGKPENVIKGAEAHNKIIKDIATCYKNVIFVEQDRLIPKSGIYFDDFCHFTYKGSERFVDNILEVFIEK